MKSSSPLNKFQKNLKEDEELKESFVTNEFESSSDDDDDEEQDRCKIVFPKKKKNSDTSHDLLVELIRQQKILAKTQKKMYSLQSAIDSEEITNRYLKLDLNNAQVKFTETNDKLKKCRKELKNKMIQNYVFLGVSGLFTVYKIYMFFQSFWEEV